MRDDAGGGKAGRCPVPLSIGHDDGAHRLEEGVFARAVDGSEHVDAVDLRQVLGATPGHPNRDAVGQQFSDPNDLLEALAAIDVAEEADGPWPFLGWADGRPLPNEVRDVDGVGRGIDAFDRPAPGFGQCEERAVPVDPPLEGAGDGPQRKVNAVGEYAGPGDEPGARGQPDPLRRIVHGGGHGNARQVRRRPEWRQRSGRELDVHEHTTSLALGHLRGNLATRTPQVAD